VEKLRESGIVSPDTKVTEMSHHPSFKNENAHLLGETNAYAIIGIGKESTTPLIASILSVGKENMEKLRDTQNNDHTVLLEKANGKIAVKTPKEIVQEKEQSKEQGR
jgi:hypothetical protein